MIRHALDLIVETGRKRVGLLGFSFKAGTDDLRESPMVALIEKLLGIKMEMHKLGTNIEYIKDADEAAKRVEEGTAEVIFFMNPTKVSEVKDVAGRFIFTVKVWISVFKWSQHFVKLFFE